MSFRRIAAALVLAFEIATLPVARADEFPGADGTQVAVGAAGEFRFPDGVPGDGPVALPPGSPQAARFIIATAPDHHFVVTMPDSVDLSMQYELGNGFGQTVLVERLECLPSCSALESSGLVGHDGNATFRIGALAGVRRITLPRGPYSALFVPTIIFP